MRVLRKLPLSKTRTFLWTAFVAVLVIGLWLALRAAVGSSSLTLDWKLRLLLGGASVCLIFGVAGLSRVARYRLAAHAASSETNFITPLLVLALAYLTPLVAFIVPDWIDQHNASVSAARLLPPFTEAGMIAGKPWAFLWQSGVLLIYFLWRGRRTALIESAQERLPQGLPARADVLWIAFSIASGVALWLAAMFLFSLTANLPGCCEAPRAALLGHQLSLPLNILTLLTAVLIAPLAVENFFRGELLSRWSERLGVRGATLATAVIFASVHFNLLIWLPAFMLGLGLAEMTRRSGGLRAAILAHAVYNALLILLNGFALL